MGNLLTLVYDVLGFNKPQPLKIEDKVLTEKEVEIYKRLRPYLYDEDLR